MFSPMLPLYYVSIKIKQVISFEWFYFLSSRKQALLSHTWPMVSLPLQKSCKENSRRGSRYKDQTWHWDLQNPLAKQMVISEGTRKWKF